MTQSIYYFSPTTPGQAQWTEDLTGNVRLAEQDGLQECAELGKVGTGGIVIDDPDGTLDFVGYKT